MRKKIISFLLFAFLALNVNTAFAATITQWRGGTGENTPLGTETAADIDTVVFQRITDPLERLLAGYREGAQIQYLSASTLTVAAGEVCLSNSGGTIRNFHRNTASTTVGWSNIDTGTEATSTTYYIYAYQNTVTTDTFSIFISTSSTAPTGATYYRRLGSFYNNSGGNIEKITNDDNIGNQIHQAIGTTDDPTTTSATYVDLAEMSVTVTTGANPVLILFSGSFKNSNIAATNNIIIDIDGTDQAESEREAHSRYVTLYEFEMSTTWLTTLTAGEHTIKIQWKASGATLTAIGDLRALQVIELK